MIPLSPPRLVTPGRQAPVNPEAAAAPGRAQGEPPVQRHPRHARPQAAPPLPRRHKRLGQEAEQGKSP